MLGSAKQQTLSTETTKTKEICSALCMNIFLKILLNCSSKEEINVEMTVYLGRKENVSKIKVPGNA